MLIGCSANKTVQILANLDFNFYINGINIIELWQMGGTMNDMLHVLTTYICIGLQQSLLDQE